MGTESMIKARGLTKKYGETTVVDGIDLTVREGAVCAVLGPNGAGKTTTVRMLATLLRATAGSASVAGHDTRREAHRVRRLIGLTGQYASVDRGRVMADGTPNELRSRVGGRTLTVRPRHDYDLQLVQERMTGATHESPSTSRGSAQVPIDGIRALESMIVRLAGIDIAELSMNDPSLEETFLRLTAAPAPASDR